MVQFSRSQSLVLSQLARVLFPAALVIGSCLVVERHSAVKLPRWLITLAAILTIPSYHVCGAWLRYRQECRKAVRLGAILPPRWDGKLPGNWDTLSLVNEVAKNGFLSDHLWEKMDPEELGPTFDFYILWNHDICTSDAGIIKTVLSTGFDNWVKGDQFSSYMHSVLGTGVFNSDGDPWKFHRAMARPFFSRERVRHFDIFDRHAGEAIAKIKQRFADGYTLDFQDLIARFMMDSATEFLFGSCVHSLNDTLPYPHFVSQRASDDTKSAAETFAEAFRDAQWAISARTRLVWLWPWAELFEDRTKKPMEVVDAFLKPIIDKALRKNPTAQNLEDKEDGTADETFLASLVRATSDPIILHDEVLNILVAGRDTMAGMLTIAVYFLSQYPAALQREEILTQLGPNERPTYDDIRDMKYLRAVLNETMRLYPALPWNMRYAVEDTILPNSDPKGKPWFVPAVHHYWGPDAEEFDPDRFLDERVHRYLTPNPFIFLPFNAGPRICLGQQLAYNEMSFFMVRLLQNFDDIQLDQSAQPPGTLPSPPAEWKNWPGRKGVEKICPRSHLTLYVHGGLWIRMREAKEVAP